MEYEGLGRSCRSNILSWGWRKVFKKRVERYSHALFGRAKLCDAVAIHPKKRNFRFWGFSRCHDSLRSGLIRSRPEASNSLVGLDAQVRQGPK